MRQQSVARFTTVSRKPEESQTVQMSRELHPAAYAGHGQVTKSENPRLHAERDVAFAGVLWETTKITKYVSAVEQIRKITTSHRQTYGSKAVDAR